MRIDTTRNQIATTQALLTRALAEAEDLHVLAYERQAASEDIKVNGGKADYALDTHGDVRVREAYRAFIAQLTMNAAALEDAAHQLLAHLSRDTKNGHRGPRISLALQNALLLEAKARRAARGEYQPHQGLPQPAKDDAFQAALQDNARLERENKKLTRDLDEANRDRERLRADRKRRTIRSA